MHNAKTWMAIWVLGTLWWTACNPPHAAEVTLPLVGRRLLTTNRTPPGRKRCRWQKDWLDPRATLHVVGVSDVGRPIHALVLASHPADHDATPDAEGVRRRLEAQREDRVTVLVNNAIHPGEPCVVNASLALAAQWLATPHSAEHPLASANWVIVPQYNVGGASRRNCCTRANQNGPEQYGFRATPPTWT